MSEYIQIYDGEFSTPNREKGDIIALACIIVKADTLEKVDSFVGYACPRDLNCWNWHSENAHKITKQAASKFPSQRELAVNLLHFLKPYKNEDDTKPMPMIIHASSYIDYNFIISLYSKVGIIGSIEKVMQKSMIVRTDVVFKEYLKSNDLEYTKTNLKRMSAMFDHKLNHHECMSDAEGCYIGLKKMVEYFKDKPPLYGLTKDFSAFNKVSEMYIQ